MSAREGQLLKTATSRNAEGKAEDTSRVVARLQDTLVVSGAHCRLYSGPISWTLNEIKHQRDTWSERQARGGQGPPPVTFNTLINSKPA